LRGFNPILVRFQLEIFLGDNTRIAGRFNPILVRFQPDFNRGLPRPGLLPALQPFQSHIGPISTRRFLYRDIGEGEVVTVSIPYWSDFNTKRPKRPSSASIVVSIPYWSDFNVVRRLRGLGIISGFNPILVRFQLREGPRARPPVLLLGPPGVFQSHIGPISTSRGGLVGSHPL